MWCYEFIQKEKLTDFESRNLLAWCTCVYVACGTGHAWALRETGYGRAWVHCDFDGECEKLKEKILTCSEKWHENVRWAHQRRCS